MKLDWRHYSILGLCALALWSEFRPREPEIQFKTKIEYKDRIVTRVQIVEKIVNRDKIVTREVTRTKPSGEIVVTKETINDRKDSRTGTVQSSAERETTRNQEQTLSVNRAQSAYLLGGSYDILHNGGGVYGLVRLGRLPAFAGVGLSLSNIDQPLKISNYGVHLHLAIEF